MAPPGINTFFDRWKFMTFSSDHVAVLTSSKSGFSSSLSLVSTSTSLSDLSSSLASIHSDHDYGRKPVMSNVEHRMNAKTVDCCSPSVHYDGNSDAMLSSCAIDVERVPGDGTDTDFLKELDDLNFSFDDLDPCCEVAMEDSFQDFIDSALEHSYPSFLSEISIDRQARDQDPVILNKEQFLATLNLQPRQESQNSCELWSPLSTNVTPDSCFSSRSSLDETVLDRTFHTPSELTKLTSDVIPTKQCSCIELESVFKSLYSTAHVPYQECVRICPSTMTTNKKVDVSDNKDYSHTKITPEILMTPLFIDTSSSELSECSQTPSEDYQDVPIEDDMLKRIDRDTADIMKWLSGSEQEDQQQYNDSNNNVINKVPVNGAVTVAETSHQVSTVADTSHQGSTVAHSLDLESFVDIEDFELVTVDNEETQERSDIHVDCKCERTADKSKHKNTNISHISMSNLKFSFLKEHMDLMDKVRQGSYSDVFSQSSVRDELSPRSSDLSYCGFSPAWSRTDSIQTSASPVPLASSDMSLFSNSEDAMEDDSVTSPLALLNLFSDENATSLLHTDSNVPNFRFM